MSRAVAVYRNVDMALTAYHVLRISWKQPQTGESTRPKYIT